MFWVDNFFKIFPKNAKRNDLPCNDLYVSTVSIFDKNVDFSKNSGQVSNDQNPARCDFWGGKFVLTVIHHVS